LLVRGYDYPIPQPSGLLPRYLREPLPDGFRNLRRCLTENSEIPQQRLLAQPVSMQLLDRDTVGKLGCPLGRLDRRIVVSRGGASLTLQSVRAPVYFMLAKARRKAATAAGWPSSRQSWW
jgi:hypothetical protein